jgi:HAD superfamily hydrolase (TIGR01509 family)
MCKLIIFDLDGVLVDAKEIHYTALNQALSIIDNKFAISLNEHLQIYDGLKTTQKLNLLTENKQLPLDKHKTVWNNKQLITQKLLSNIQPSSQLIEIFQHLTENGYKLACCSNSIRKTVYLVLSKLGILHFFDIILSNNDVILSKPHPEIYWKAMIDTGTIPEETLIIEDSPVGLLGASRSGSHILRIDSPHTLTLDLIMNKLKSIIDRPKTIKWKGENLNVLIPMAGAGSRFETAGYTFPKPLIDICGRPMIQVVVENLNIEANYIFVVRKEHREKYNLDILLNLIAPNCKIIETDKITEGSAITTLLAKELIDNDCPLLIANSDQYILWNSVDFMYKMIAHQVDGGILTFESSHPKWSFVKTDERGNVTEVAEKRPISNKATTGIYYWAKGSDYVKFAEQMIEKNLKINNEFYVCPVFNEAITNNKKIEIYDIEKMWGLGTPEDLNTFLYSKDSPIK